MINGQLYDNWLLIEGSVHYGSGSISQNGVLEGIPSSREIPYYDYEGFLQLRLICGSING